MDNYPIWLFDKDKYTEKNERFNSKTLGFRLESLRTILRNEDEKNNKDNELESYDNNEKNKNNIFNFLKSLFFCFYYKQESDFNLNSEGHLPRTVNIHDCKIPLLKFNLDIDEKESLIESGRVYASDYLVKVYDNKNKSNILVYRYY